MTNLLIDKLPESVWVNGKEYGISWDFRTSILFELLMQDPEYSDEEKIIRTMQLYFTGEMPDDWQSALDEILKFYLCEEERGVAESSNIKRKKTPCYSFEQDAAYIYAAFLDQYGLDLNGIGPGELHWWKFSAMFQSLREELPFSKIMYYRDVDLKGKKGKERKFLQAMKKRYALRTQVQASHKLSLAQRNAEMKAYVARRFKELESR